MKHILYKRQLVWKLNALPGNQSFSPPEESAIMPRLGQAATADTRAQRTKSFMVAALLDSGYWMTCRLFILAGVCPPIGHSPTPLEAHPPRGTSPLRGDSACLSVAPPTLLLISKLLVYLLKTFDTNSIDFLCTIIFQ